MKKKKQNKKTAAQQIFDSLKQFSAASGFTVDQLVAMKNTGCPAFRNSRVYKDELYAWIERTKHERAVKEEREGTPEQEFYDQFTKLYFKWAACTLILNDHPGMFPTAQEILKEIGKLIHQADLRIMRWENPEDENNMNWSFLPKEER